MANLTHFGAISDTRDLADRRGARGDKSRRDVRFGSKVCQIGQIWEKSGAFSDQISVHLAPLVKNRR